METEVFLHPKSSRLVSWKVREGGYVKKGHVILDYTEIDDGGSKTLKYKTTKSGVVTKLMVRKGDSIINGVELMTLEECSHSTIITDLCALCGVDFRKLEDNAKPTGASVSMIHTVPDLKCSIKEAKEISKTEENRLLKQRKLHLLVDLDQTLIHTTNMDVPAFVNDVFHFRLQGSPLTYHTRLRPGTRTFLDNISKLYELHICTFGSRNYAHSIARHLDPDGTLFYIRILSRDECFNQNSKTANLSDLFPSGDHMVCIIDDREDVWNFTPNLIHVKPYHFFSKTGDINAPPALSKREDDNKIGFDFTGGGVKQLAKRSVPPEEKPKVVEADSTTDLLVKTNQVTTTTAKETVSNDLLLTDESDNSTAKDEVDSDSSSSSEQTEVSSPKPDVPHVFDDEEDGPKDTGQKEDATVTSTLSEPASSGGESTGGKVEEEEKGKEKVDDEVKKDEALKSDKLPDEAPAQAQPEAVDVPERGPKAEGNAEKEVKEKEMSEDEKQFLLPDSDDYLLYLEDILKRIHGAFYNAYDSRGKEENLPNVKEIIPSLRKNVLKGCSIVFSGVVPVGAKLESSPPYGVAVALGAVVTEKLIPPRRSSQPSTSKEIPATTHVVAARIGTAKTNEARRYKGMHIVTPDWLWCCAERWEHVDERLFNLCKKSTVRRHPPSHLSIERDSEGSASSNPEQAQDDDAFLPKDTVVDAAELLNGGVVLPPGTRRVRTLSGRFMDTINPLLSFSVDEIADMDHEVDDICGLSGSSSDAEEPPKRDRVIRRRKTRESITTDNRISAYNDDKGSSSDDSSDDEDSGDRERMRKRKRDLPPTEDEPEEEESLVTKFRRGEPLPSDVEMLNLTNQTSDDDNDTYIDLENEWMARQLEAELLGVGDSSQDV